MIWLRVEGLGLMHILWSRFTVLGFHTFDGLGSGMACNWEFTTV